MLQTTTAIRAGALVTQLGAGVRNRVLDDRGQSTAEYALLLLGVAAIALAVTTWATGTGKIAELFDAVVDSIIGRV